MTTVPEQFERNGYVRLPSLIPLTVADSLRLYVRRLAKKVELQNDAQVPGTPGLYGEPLMEQLLEELLPSIEQASGRSLFPTDAYFRVYKHGDELKRHKDRDSCEISVLLCLGARGEQWPLFVEGPLGVHAAAMGAGDGLLYKGAECPHWREPFTGEWMVQVFLHYVDRNGPYAAMRFDRRESLNLRENAQRLLPANY